MKTVYENKPVNVPLRRAFAELLRQYGSGRITEKQLINSHLQYTNTFGDDEACDQILEVVLDEFDPVGWDGVLPKNIRRHPRTRRIYARLVVFLHSDLPYIESELWKTVHEKLTPNFKSWWVKRKIDLRDEISIFLLFPWLLLMTIPAVIELQVFSTLQLVLVILFLLAMAGYFAFLAVKAEEKKLPKPLPESTRKLFDKERPRRKQVDQYLFPFASLADLDNASKHPRFLAGISPA